VKARYRATLDELCNPDAEWETIGEPEVRDAAEPWGVLQPVCGIDQARES